MAVWELESPGEAPPSVDLPFVGRRSELEILDLAYRRSSQRAVLALVSGPPGQGKTRAVREFLERIGRPFLLGRFRPLGEIEAGAAWRELLGGPAVDREAVAAQLGSIEDPSERDRIIRGVRHGAGITADDDLLALGNEERTDEIVHAWRRYFAARSPDAPPLIWLEDLHWADQASVRTIERLTLSSGPLFLVATARPEFAQAAGLRPSGDRFFVELDPLDHDDAVALAGHAGAADLTTIERAQGNPLFIVELARTAEHGVELPLTLQGALGARLTQNSRRIARTESDQGGDATGCHPCCYESYGVGRRANDLHFCRGALAAKRHHARAVGSKCLLAQPAARCWLTNLRGVSTSIPCHPETESRWSSRDDNTDSRCDGRCKKLIVIGICTHLDRQWCRIEEW